VGRPCPCEPRAACCLCCDACDTRCCKRQASICSRPTQKRLTHARFDVSTCSVPPATLPRVLTPSSGHTHTTKHQHHHSLTQLSYPPRLLHKETSRFSLDLLLQHLLCPARTNLILQTSCRCGLGFFRLQPVQISDHISILQYTSCRYCCLISGPSICQ
jgi:hypothetical protein